MIDGVLVIDADEFEEALRDPDVIALHERARAYRRHLIDHRGHCSMCLVVNCEHLSRLPRGAGIFDHGRR